MTTGCALVHAERAALAADVATVDAVLLLGALYHLVDASDRAAALAESYRVLDPAEPSLPRGSRGSHPPTTV